MDKLWKTARLQPKWPAIRAASLRATSTLLCLGQRSASPPLVNRVTALPSEPNTSSETSLPTIQSQPLRDSLARALASSSVVSAAKPSTSFGRFFPAAETADLEANARAKLSRKGCDWIVANDVSGEVFGSGDNAVTLFTREGGVETWPRQPKSGVARKLAERIAGHFA